MDPVMAGAKVIFSVSEGGRMEIAEMVDTLVVFVRLVAIPLAVVAVTSVDTCMVAVLVRAEVLVPEVKVEELVMLPEVPLLPVELVMLPEVPLLPVLVLVIV
jgi:hypothetical protein